jgi:LysR family transcriptional regulator (chromosome initiation inhibitor)
MPAVVYNKKDALHDDMIERVFHLTKVSHPKIYVPSPDIFVESIVQSCGYGMVPTLQVKQLLHDKTLIDLTPQHHTKLPLYWCHWVGQSELLQKLTSLIENHARSSLI